MRSQWPIQIPPGKKHNTIDKLYNMYKSDVIQTKNYVKNTWYYKYILDTNRAMRQSEFQNMDKGDMTITKHEDKLLILLAFSSNI